MAFLVYFFMLLLIAGSVLFGLDWVKAPLHTQQRTHLAATSEHLGSRKASVASVPIGRTQPPSSMAQSEPEQKPVVAQPPRLSTPAAPPEEKQAATAGPPAKPERVIEQQPSSATAAAQSEPTHAAAKQPAVPKATANETTGAAPAETQKAEAKRKTPEPNASQVAAAPQTRPRAYTAARPHEHERTARVPSWAIRGAEAAQREQAEERQEPAPEWAIRGAEAARREAEGAQARPAFRPFWVSRDDGGRW